MRAAWSVCRGSCDCNISTDGVPATCIFCDANVLNRHGSFFPPTCAHYTAMIVVELYRLDAVASYQHAFVYIRQLAIHLRNASLAKKKDTHLQVYNWQYLYAIRVWSKLLAEEVSPGTKDGTVPRVVLCTTASPPRGCRQRAW
eukprot:m.429891 g.429891  ORF g.429891 m.429891 type:complete len:143 (+) comp21389_c0_seq5:1602-2030(+)